MFISLSKTIARFDGFRLGVGMRLTGKNSSWMSIIFLIVVMFQLMWSLLILCGWIIYAIIYAICWCIRKNKTKSPSKSKTTQIHQTNRKEDTPIMTPETNNSTNTNLETKPPKKKGTVARWIIGGVFALIALSNGFHYSTIFLLCSAFLMLPLSFMQAFLSERNIKASVAIVLSVALLLIGAIFSPPTESAESTPDNTTQTAPTNNNDNTSISKPSNSTSNNSSAKPNNSSTNNNSSSNNNSSEKPNDSTSNKGEEKVEMVWIVSTGTKYHSDSTCSKMTSPQKVTIDEAKELGYTACKKCR